MNMTKYILTPLLLILFSLTTLAQDCDPERPPTDRCEDANVLCDLDGWCGNSGGFTDTGQPNAFCGIVENNCWVSFRAFTTFLEIEITTSNCSNNNGVQAQMFYTEDCQNFQSISNCLDPAPANQSSIFLSDNLTPGTIYHIMVDGKGGDFCDFSFKVLRGSTSPAAFASVQDNFKVCERDTFTLGNGLASIDAYSYFWTTDTGNIISSPDNPTVLADTIGNYTLTVVDKPHSCIDSATLSVVYDEPAITTIIEPDSLDCGANMMIDLDASSSEFEDDFTAEWTRFDGEVLSTDLILSDVNVPGFYYLTIENATGCVAKDSVEVVNSVEFPIAFAGMDQELNCVTSAVILDGSDSSIGSNFEYDWQGENNVSLQNGSLAQTEVDSAGTYYLVVTNTDNDCSSTDEVEVVLNDAVPNSVTANIDAPCFNEPFGSLEVIAVEGGNSPYQFIFDGMETSTLPNLSQIAPGSYDLTVIDAIGCSLDTNLIVETPEIIVLALGEDKTIDLGETIQLETQLNRPMENIIWSPDLGCDQCEEVSFRPLVSTSYQVTAIDSIGCSVMDTILINVIAKDKVFFPNVFSPNGDGVNDFYQVFGGTDVAQINYLRIFDRMGNQVFQQENFQPNLIENSWDGTFNNKFLNPQVLAYVIEVQFINGIEKIYGGDITLLR